MAAIVFASPPPRNFILIQYSHGDSSNVILSTEPGQRICGGAILHDYEFIWGVLLYSSLSRVFIAPDGLIDCSDSL